jgi:CRP-like cAMP-binding protein/Fe-S-cluster-containing hydrogenase component 2
MSARVEPDAGRTTVKRLEQYKDRWNSYGANTGILELSEKLSPGDLRRFELFREYDDEFLEKISTDISVVRWKKNSTLFEEGAYIDLAFIVVQGSVEVYLQKLREQTMRVRPIFDAARTMLGEATGKNAPQRPEPMDGRPQKKSDKPGSDIVFLSSMDFNLPASGDMMLGPGEIFGEIGAMSGWPQSVTARAATDCVLLQIRVAALRLMKSESAILKQRIDKVYRERSLAVQLKTTPLLQRCDDAFIESLAKKVELVSCKPDEIITREGEPAEALYLLRSGFLKLWQKLGEGQIVVSYLSKGMTLGDVELLLQESNRWACTATSVEFTELVKIAREDFYALIKKFPGIEKQLWATATARIKEAGASRKNISQSEFIQAAMEKGLVQGSSILLIDLDTCTRCDDCVRGCAETHGGRPRFVREGDKYENLLITKACYQCRDPVCLVGCPTGAIRRASVGEVVEIVDNLCIGCQACAKNCPYDAIVMHDTGEVWTLDALPEYNRGKPRLLASKCDLCYKTNHGPACVNNCPQGCAFRIESLGEFQQLLAKSS